MLISSFLFILCCGVQSEIIELTSHNFEDKIASKTIIFVNFFANWCSHCRDFAPTFKTLDENVQASELVDVVALATVDSVAEPDLITKFKINRYPSLCIFKNGKSTNQQFFGPRKIPQLMKFLRDAYPRILPVNSKEDLVGKKFAVVLLNGASNEKLYADFEKLHHEYYQKCQFYKMQKTPIPSKSFSVLFHSDSPFHIQDNFEYIEGEYDKFENWIKLRCIPFVEQITFDNAASITSSAKPLVVVIYSAANSSLLQKVDENLNNLKPELEEFIPVFADADEFQYILNRVQKSMSDLPLVILDDMKHVYYFGPTTVLESKTNFSKLLAAHKNGQLVDTYVFPKMYIEIIEIHDGHAEHHKIELDRVQPPKINFPESDVPKKSEIILNHEQIDATKKNDVILNQEPINPAKRREQIKRSLNDVHDKKVEESDHPQKTSGNLMQSLFKSLMPDSNSFTMATQDEL